MVAFKRGALPIVALAFLLRSSNGTVSVVSEQAWKSFCEVRRIIWYLSCFWYQAHLSES